MKTRNKIFLRNLLNEKNFFYILSGREGKAIREITTFLHRTILYTWNNIELPECFPLKALPVIFPVFFSEFSETSAPEAWKRNGTQILPHSWKFSWFTAPSLGEKRFLFFPLSGGNSKFRISRISEFFILLGIHSYWL